MMTQKKMVSDKPKESGILFEVDVEEQVQEEQPAENAEVIVDESPVEETPSTDAFDSYFRDRKIQLDMINKPENGCFGVFQLYCRRTEKSCDNRGFQEKHPATMLARCLVCKDIGVRLVPNDTC